MNINAISILKENQRRNNNISAIFNPITGEGSILQRKKALIADFALPVQYLPHDMMRVPLVKQLVKAGSIADFLNHYMDCDNSPDNRDKVIRQFVRIRCRYDFPFWAAYLVMIKAKGGGEDVHFRLNRPQRRFVTMLEQLRLANKPIRIIMLKARQWGGSTVTQLYMAWLQLVHRVGLNSLIVGHVKDTSLEVKDMFARMLNAYPTQFLYKPGESFSPTEPKLVGVGNSGNIQRVPQRNCKIKIGTAEKPDSARGGDYNLVHCTEVGLWKTTDHRTPEQIIRSACSGILLKPYTMIVYESTANGTGNFFHREYVAASKGTSQFLPLFVPWYEIEQYQLPLDNPQDFATQLLKYRLQNNAPSDRQEPGAYLWWLWERGATLEAINWYISERSKYSDHGDMASEYPSDDVEAFVHSGARVFDKYKVDLLARSCRAPKFIGEVYADGDEGKQAFSHIRFRDDPQGNLYIWAKPEIDHDERVTNRYLVVVDIGGRSSSADFSVICVFDRLFQIDGDGPSVVAQWYGHIDMDLLAWRSAQIAAYYDNALLVIESNTLETHDRERQVDGDQSGYILNLIKDCYDNLYARTQSEADIQEGRPLKYGFHTNTATKPVIISTLVKAVRDSLYTERDSQCCHELLCYERKQNGSYGAIRGEHDDILMTRAIGLHIAFHEMDLPTIVPRQRQHRKAASTVSEATL